MITSSESDDYRLLVSCLLHFYEGINPLWQHFYEGIISLWQHFYEGIFSLWLHFYEGIIRLWQHFYEDMYVLGSFLGRLFKIRKNVLHEIWKLIRKFHAPASPHSGWYMVARYEREGTCSLSLMPGYWICPRCTLHAVGVQLGLGEQPFFKSYEKWQVTSDRKFYWISMI